MSLKDIPVHFDSGPGPAGSEPTGMAEALLREVADHLLTVAQGGERQVVELGNLPLSEGDLRLLEERLGRGEVEAKISASGLTEVYETAFHGVWWVKYFDNGDRPAAQQLEIGTVPMILEAHPEDIQASAERFSQLFEEPVRNSH
ncbi:hydrogenase expression/formation protein [Thioalkalivibrio sp.]|uniref:hydrogenase expression/formation protein n=1 Tax=Thioalkalivibrio sp. TaxID=2093813 RepID=UPI003975BA11